MPTNLPDGYVYVLGPIDWWPAWTTIDTPPAEEYASQDHAAQERSSRAQVLEHAKEQFRRAGWEGDVRQGPFFAGLPTDDITGEVMVGLKQDNNGMTFIWSPFELVWLNDRRPELG